MWSACGPDGPDLVLGPGDAFGEVAIEWVEHEWMRTRGRRLWVQFTQPAKVFVLTVMDDQAPAQLGFVAINNAVWVGPGRSGFTTPYPGSNGDSTAYFSGVAGLDPSCVAVDALVDGNREGTVGRLVVQPRFEPPGNVLPVDVVIAGDLSLTQRRRETIIRHANTALTASGAPRLEVVGIHRIDGPSAARHGTPAFDRWYASSEGDPLVPDLVFIDRVRGVRRSEDDAFMGRAHVPGVAFPGARRSGMLVVARWGKNWRLSPADIGRTVAHEVGHFLGLNHTTDKHGTRRATLPDVPLCSIDLDADGDGELSSPECADFDGRNLMFWTTWENSIDEVWLSESQVRLMRLHPAVRYVPELDPERASAPGRTPEVELE